jgi:hypothetical protein
VTDQYLLSAVSELMVSNLPEHQSSLISVEITKVNIQITTIQSK